MSLAERIKHARVAKGWSRELLAVYAGVSVATIGRIERDELVPRAASIVALARVLGLPAEELAAEVGLTIHIPPDKWS